MPHIGDYGKVTPKSYSLYVYQKWLWEYKK